MRWNKNENENKHSNKRIELYWKIANTIKRLKKITEGIVLHTLNRGNWKWTYKQNVAKHKTGWFELGPSCEANNMSRTSLKA